MLKRAYETEGIKGYWRKELETTLAESQRRYVAPAALAQIYASLEERDKAFEYLEKAYAERSPQIVSIKTDPLLDSLRSDTRFADLLKRMGFSP